MPRISKKKSVLESDLWKTIVAVSVILGIFGSVVAILQYLGTIDFLTPVQEIMDRQISFSIMILLLIGTSVLTCIALKAWESDMPKKSILDYSMARRLAGFCQRPQTTESLKERYYYWKKKNTRWFKGYSFDDYMKRLENEGHLTYDKETGAWIVNAKALEYITKYHGT
jgi:hypothetical protein